MADDQLEKLNRLNKLRIARDQFLMGRSVAEVNFDGVTTRYFDSSENDKRRLFNEIDCLEKELGLTPTTPQRQAFGVFFGN